jgi:very-short-patch-repair endonuclease
MPIEEISDALKAGSVLETGFKPRDYLQLYLAYARAVSEGNLERRDYILGLLLQQAATRTSGGPESPLEEEVLDVLKRLGLTVHPQVGQSGFRIDLAVLHPEPARGYMLGIECDGATYHSDRSARIRDVWREEILRKRGWRLHRIWSTRWWNDRAEEIEKLKHALSEAAELLSSRSDYQKAETITQPGPSPIEPSEVARGQDSAARRSGSEMRHQKGEARICASCGAKAVRLHKGQPICLECYRACVIPPGSEKAGGTDAGESEQERILEEGRWDNIVSSFEDNPETLF